MAREKDLLLEETSAGHLYVDDNVIRIAANVVAKEVEGVYNLTGKLVDVFNSNRKGVDIKSTEEHLHVEVSVGVIHGYKIIDVARRVQQSVLLSLRENFEIEQVTVDVTIKELLVQNELDELEE